MVCLHGPSYGCVRMTVMPERPGHTVSLRMQDQAAEEELKNLRALALSLQGATAGFPETHAEGSENEQMALQLQQLDALDIELEKFERRFASADPDVKRMLAQMLSHDGLAPELIMFNNSTPGDPSFALATPDSSDSAQTYPIAERQPTPNRAVHEVRGEAECLPGGAISDNAIGAANCQPPSYRASSEPGPKSSAGKAGVDGSIVSPGQANHTTTPYVTDTVSGALFPAVTPANSLAQQSTGQRDTLSDCAASIPLPACKTPVRHCLCCPPCASCLFHHAMCRLSIDAVETDVIIGTCWETLP